MGGEEKWEWIFFGGRTTFSRRQRVARGGDEGGVVRGLLSREDYAEISFLLLFGKLVIIIKFATIAKMGGTLEL